MIHSKKLLVLLTALITVQVIAMEPDSASMSRAGQILQHPVDENLKSSERETLDEKKIEAQRAQVNLEIEQQSKLAAIGVGAATAVVSSPWISSVLRYSPLILLGIAGVGFAAWKLSQRTDYWGFRSFFRRRSVSWNQLQQNISALRTQRAQEAQLRIATQIQSLQDSVASEQQARALAESQHNRLAQLHAEVLEAHLQTQRAHQAEISAEIQQRQLSEEARHQLEIRANQVEQELQRAHASLARLQQDLEDMQAANALLSGDIQQDRAVVVERNQAIAQLQQEIRLLRQQAQSRPQVQETYETFIESIDRCRVETVRRLVTNHREWVNQRDAARALPLCHALLLYTSATASGQQPQGNRENQRSVVTILLTAGAQWNQRLQDNVAGDHRTGFDVAIGLKDIELLRPFVVAGARLHNISVQHRLYVHALNNDDADTDDVRRNKQEILHLFAQVDSDGSNNCQPIICPVCNESLTERAGESWVRDLGVYWCGHFYCQGCFNLLMNRHAECPVCRQAPPQGAVSQNWEWDPHPDQPLIDVAPGNANGQQNQSLLSNLRSFVSGFVSR